MSSPDRDAEDAALAADGDERAFERLYRRHVPRIHSLARRMVGPEEADEVTQRAFVRAWRKLDQFRGDGPTWRPRGTCGPGSHDGSGARPRPTPRTG